jgi:hypothetical protein
MDSDSKMDENPLALLKEYLEHDGIRHYDSSLCWGCGELKVAPCEPDCLLERTRQALAAAGVETLPK